MQSSEVVYLVDPDASIVEALATLLSTYDIHVESYRDAETFLQNLPSLTIGISCLIVENNLPGISGLSLIRSLKKTGVSLPFIIMTNNINANLLHQANMLGAVDVVKKPLVDSLLIPHLAKLFGTNDES